jgi:hypothetical protein
MRTKKQCAHIATLLVCLNRDGRRRPAFSLTRGRELPKITTRRARSRTERLQSSQSASDCKASPTPPRAPLLLSVPRDILIPRQIPIRLVSPFDFQTAAHQLEQARAAGFDIGENNVIKDEGVSGISTCFAERDGGRRLLDKLRPGDVLVVRWLDRLGHNYDNVRDTVQALRVRFGT